MENDNRQDAADITIAARFKDVIKNTCKQQPNIKQA
jgi:hypothetical protein